MMKDVYKINGNGFYIDVYKINVEENTYYNGFEWLEIDFEFVDIPPMRAKSIKWDNGEWIIIEEYPIEEILPQPQK